MKHLFIVVYFFTCVLTQFARADCRVNFVPTTDDENKIEEESYQCEPILQALEKYAKPNADELLRGRGQSKQFDANVCYHKKKQFNYNGYTFKVVNDELIAGKCKFSIGTNRPVPCQVIMPTDKLDRNPSKSETQELINLQKKRCQSAIDDLNGRMSTTFFDAYVCTRKDDKEGHSFSLKSKSCARGFCNINVKNGLFEFKLNNVLCSYSITNSDSEEALEGVPEAEDNPRASGAEK